MAQNHAGTANYDENFYRMNKDGSYRSASIILPIVRDYIQPKTVLDIGCGVGTWLAAWKNLGAEVTGVDGDYVDRTQLFIPQENFQSANLENRIEIDKKFDLVETLEVAEHLTPARADSFVEDLTRLSDVVLFSAAILGQGGVNHVNEQMQSYWAEKFSRHGYVVVDCIRPQVWSNGQIEVWYRQNILLYVKRTELYRYPELQEYYLKHRASMILDVVHPELWAYYLCEFSSILQKAKLQLQNGGGGAVGRHFYFLQKKLPASCGLFLFLQIPDKVRIGNLAHREIFVVRGGVLQEFLINSRIR